MRRRRKNGPILSGEKMVDNPVVVNLVPITGKARDAFGGGFGVLSVSRSLR